MNLDNLEQLLETMEPSEIRAKYARELKHAPDCEALLQQFESLDGQLLSLKHLEEAPTFKTPKRQAKHIGWAWVLPMAAVLILGLLFGSGLMNDRMTSFEADLEQFATNNKKVPGSEPSAPIIEEAEADLDFATDRDDETAGAVGVVEAPAINTQDTYERLISPSKPAAPSSATREEAPAVLSDEGQSAPPQAVGSAEATGLKKDAKPRGDQLQTAKEAAPKPKKENRARQERSRRNRESPVGRESLEKKAEKQKSSAAPVEQGRGLPQSSAVNSEEYLMVSSDAAAVVPPSESELVVNEMILDSSNQPSAEVVAELVNQEPYRLWLERLQGTFQFDRDWRDLFTQDARIAHVLPGGEKDLSFAAFGKLWEAQYISPNWKVIEIKKQINDYRALLEVVPVTEPDQPVIWELRLILTEKGLCEQLLLKGLALR